MSTHSTVPLRTGFVNWLSTIIEKKSGGSIATIGCGNRQNFNRCSTLNGKKLEKKFSIHLTSTEKQIFSLLNTAPLWCMVLEKNSIRIDPHKRKKFWLQYDCGTLVLETTHSAVDPHRKKKIRFRLLYYGWLRKIILTWLSSKKINFCIFDYSTTVVYRTY